MIFQWVREDEDVIEVDHYEDISHVSEDVIHEGLEHCIGSPQLWTDMSCSQAGPLTLGWWCHSICSKDFCDLRYTHLKKYYLHVQFASVQFASIWFASVRFASVWFASVQAELPADKAGHQLIPHCLAIFMNIASSARPVDLSLWKKMQIKVAVKVDKRDVKETRCHSETIEVPLEENRYLRSLIWLENVSSLLVLYAWI